MKNKTVSLDSFVKNTHKILDLFAEQYKKKRTLIDNPENYPLKLPVENSGLWMEFFNEFYENGWV